MNRYARRTLGVTRSMVAAARSESITFVAAGLAYYAFVSLLPLLLLSLVVASTLGGPTFATSIERWATGTLGPSAGDLVGEALAGAAGRGGATIVGLTVLLWSALKVFRGMDLAFSQVYGAAGPESLPEQVRDALVVLVAVGAGIGLTVGVGALLSLQEFDLVVAGVDAVTVLGSLVLVAGLTVTLLPLYYLLPDEDLALRDALPGAAFAAVGWTLLQTGFRVYAGAAGTYQAYGVIGGALLLVTLLYFGGIVLLLGVVLNAVIDGRVGRRAASLDVAEFEPPLPDAPLPMTDDAQTQTEPTDDEPDEQSLEAELEALRAEIDERTIHREEIERDLRRYVRRRVRRGKARGWGPYLVLLYGTAMTLGAFYLLSGVWAIAAMFVVWTSTLGVYVVMLLVGAGLNVAGLPGRLRDAVRDRR